MAGFWGRWKTPSQERVRLRVISVLRTAAPVSTPGLTLRSHWVEQQEALRARALRDQCTAVCTKSRRCTTAGETDAYLTRCIETQVLLCSVLLKWLTLKIAEDIAFLIKLIYSLRLYESPRRGLNLTLYLLFLQFAIICTYFCKMKMKTIIIVVWIKALDKFSVNLTFVGRYISFTNEIKICFNFECDWYRIIWVIKFNVDLAY